MMHDGNSKWKAGDKIQFKEHCLKAKEIRFGYWHKYLNVYNPEPVKTEIIILQ
jgi:ASC-1-like (ASCH) protein